MSELLQQELDRAIGDGPEHRPVEHQVRAGRRALLVRRVVAGAAALAVVGAVGTTYALVGPGAQGESVGVVDQTDGRPSPEVTPGPPDMPLDEDYDQWGAPDTVAELTEDGLAVRAGVEVLAHIDDPFDFPDPHRSVALDLDVDGTRAWVVLTFTYTEAGEPAGSSVTPGDPDRSGMTFAGWVQQEVDTQLAASPNGLVPWDEPSADQQQAAEYRKDGLVIADGVTVHQRVDEPLGPGPDRLQSVALDVEFDGNRQWLFLEDDTNGSSGVIEDDLTVAQDFDAWIQDQYDLYWAQYLVRFADEGSDTLVADRDGVEVLEQRDGLARRPGAGGGEDPVAAALVDWDGTRYLVLAYRDPMDGPRYFGIGGDWEGLATLDDYLQHEREVYAP